MDVIEWDVYSRKQIPLLEEEIRRLKKEIIKLEDNNDALRGGMWKVVHYMQEILGIRLSVEERDC